MEIDFFKLRIGDRLIRTKGGIFSKHHALYAGYWNGQHLIAENQVNYGVRYITLSQFLKDGKLVQIEYYNLDKKYWGNIIDRINKRLGRPYILIKYNCESFVNDVLYNVSKSNQINNGIIAGIGITLCLLIFGASKK